MSVYMVDNEGIAALNHSSAQVSGAGAEFLALIAGLDSAASNNPDGLGPHAGSLAAAIEEIRSAVNSSKTAADDVAQGLKTLATKYQEIIDNDPFSSSGK